MWRPLTILKKVVMPSLAEHGIPRVLFSTKTMLPRSTAKITLVSASVGVLLGAGYGGYTHYKINVKKVQKPMETEEFAFLQAAPDYKPHYRVTNEGDTSNLQLVLFQYRTCPFCCKVRAYLDARGINYDVVEVDAVLRQAIKWSGYKKVPILLAKVDGGYQQLLDSTAIISVLETHLRDTSADLREIVKYYPSTKYIEKDGKQVSDITNKYFIMHNAPAPSQLESEERKWRQWADQVLVHMLSPNVYRTPAESLETFKWFEQAGRWKEAFPAWECTLMVYFGASAMYFIAKRLKARHNVKDDVRQSLYDATNEWMKAVKEKGTPFLGGKEPNLADITVFGVLSSIEGCQAFQDLRNHTQVSQWYDNIKEVIERRKGRVVVTAVEA